jgi:LuxR family maltose regulon positive regulatory protein
MAIGHRPPAVNRFHWHLLMLTGRAAEAAALADAAGARETDVEPLAAVARWFDGSPRCFLSDPVDLLGRGYEGLADRARFDRAAFVAVMAASVGRRGILDGAVAEMANSGVAPMAAAHAALLAGSRAVQRVAHHDEAGAVALLQAFQRDLTERSAEDRRSADAHLRRSPGVPYVCLPEVRPVWDADPLGPSEVRSRAVARALVEARAGRGVGPQSEAPADPAGVVTALPLPWAVELAARAAAGGAPWGFAVAAAAVEHAGEAMVEDLAHLVRSDDEVLRAGAAALRSGLRLAPRHTVRIEVLGPLQIRRDGQLIDGRGLRRARVRALLSLLVVEGTIAREVILDRLWPDLDPERARANLRVTLTHLHAVLEPDRPRGEATSVVQADTTHLRLLPGPGLEIDLHEVRTGLAAAARARAAGHEGARREHLAAAVACWRGRALPDLDDVAGCSGTADEIGLALLEAVVTLGELDLVAGEAAAAAACARRALAADPWAERAHRLAVAAHTQAGDAPAARTAIEALDKAMHELGVPAEEATERLVRQTARRFGWPVGRR